MKRLIVLFLSLYLATTLVGQGNNKPFWTEATSPETIGVKVINELLSRNELMYFRKAHNNMAHYAEACAGMGAVRLACLLENEPLKKRLDTRYRILLEQADTFATNHVDANVLGILPLELYLCMGDEAYKKVGLWLADVQWENPLEDGMTNQTRYWIDDIFMIGCLQTQAYKVTGNQVYIERAALELDAYIRKLQQPNGLFFHGPNAPFYWGRGNGWVAAGLATVITQLPTSNPFYASLFNGYQTMMKSLLQYQMDNGMWRQLIDNEVSWEESSCTSMFGYAMKIGIDKGLLEGKEFITAYQKAWLALVDHLTEEGNLTDICVGTGQSLETQFYLDRPKRTGDLHGQAPMLWFAGSLLSE
jgi:unsaturated rhamnogalacturonyl hydrolase